MFEKFRKHFLAELVHVINYERGSVAAPRNALIGSLWSKSGINIKYSVQEPYLQGLKSLPQAFHRA